jgi:hypothetical protein
MDENYEMENSTNPGLGASPDNPDVLAEEAEGQKPAEPMEETPIVEEPTKEVPSEESVEELKAQRDRLYARLKKAEEKAKVAKPASFVPKGGEDEWKSKVEFLLENRDVTEQEYDHLANVAFRRTGSVNADSLRSAKTDETEYITFLRKKEELKRKVPGSTTSSPFAKFEKSSDEIKKMTKEQHMAYEQQMTKIAESQGI